MFSCFLSIVNKMQANKPQLPYDDHERALKLLYALDWKVWDVKVSAIIESTNYDTLPWMSFSASSSLSRSITRPKLKLRIPLHRLWLWSQVTAQVLQQTLHRCCFLVFFGVCHRGAVGGPWGRRAGTGHQSVLTVPQQPLESPVRWLKQP